MRIETIKKAEEFKQGQLNLVQYFLKKGCKFTVKDPESYATLLINTSDYESIKKAINDYDTHLEIWKNDRLISKVWIIPYNEGIDTIADYYVSKEIDDWSNKFEKTMDQLNG